MSDASRVVVTFALPDESRAFVAALADDRHVAVHHTGVGDHPERRRRLREVLARVRPRWVVSAGYAGGLQPGVNVADLILADNFSSPALLAAARRVLAHEPTHVGTLLTRETVAEAAAEKTALGRGTGALAVDMETAWIAAVCADAGLPLLSLRVVSDPATQSFPVPGRLLYDLKRQRPRYLALPLWLLAHPGRIAPFMTFVRGLVPARERLGRALRGLLSALGSANNEFPPP